MFFLGIDTSCYTTSCALVDEQGNLVSEARKLLTVKKGARGLAQSGMVFQHTRALPTLLEELPNHLPLIAIGVSAFPRREENSYMPAFLVGKGAAKNISHFTNAEIFHFSHQENHILAALRELKEPLPDEPFLGLHVSGGTTELIYCEPSQGEGFQSKIVGESMDLHAGQLVDRVGVMLGLPFPAGPSLELLAKEAETFTKLPFSIKEGKISLSGPASEAMRRIERKNESPAALGRAVFDLLGNSISKMVSYHLKKYQVRRLIAVGGVMANSFLRHDLQKMAEKENIRLDVASPRYSSDNASGVAYGAYLQYKLRHNI